MYVHKIDPPTKSWILIMAVQVTMMRESNVDYTYSLNSKWIILHRERITSCNLAVANFGHEQKRLHVSNIPRISNYRLTLRTWFSYEYAIWIRHVSLIMGQSVLSRLYHRLESTSLTMVHSHLRSFPALPFHVLVYIPRNKNGFLRSFVIG